jgi:hypothetical protein
MEYNSWAACSDMLRVVVAKTILGKDLWIPATFLLFFSRRSQESMI